MLLNNDQLFLWLGVVQVLNLDFFRIGFDIFGPRVVHLKVSNFQRFNPNLFGAQSKLEQIFSQAFLEELHPHSGETLDSQFVKNPN